MNERPPGLPVDAATAGRALELLRKLKRGLDDPARIQMDRAAVEQALARLAMIDRGSQQAGAPQAMPPGDNTPPADLVRVVADAIAGHGRAGATGASAPGAAVVSARPVAGTARETASRQARRTVSEAFRRIGLWPAPSRDAPGDRLWAAIRPVSIAGLAVIGLCFGVVGTWAALAPLAGSAIASGVVSPDSSRKTVQHLEGGIIKEILVREGDEVRAGQVLYRLEETQAQATHSARREQWLRLLVTRARLEAHTSDAAAMSLPPEAAGLESADLKSFIDNQVQLFDLRRRGLEERESILRQQLRQLDEQVRGKRLENEGLELQLSLLEEEAADKATLVRQKLARKPEYLAVQRIIAETKARMGSNVATIGALQERMGEITLQINSTRTQFRDQNAELLTKTNNDIAQLEESLVATRDILRRTDIVAPVAGTVLNLRFRTVGGVIRPGEAVVDIVPREELLIVDARLPATDIDVVRPGLPAMVHLVPYLTRDTPMLEGVVTHVGADSNVDQQSGQRFYEIKVRVDKARLDALATPVILSPGMPVEVFVLTRNRTALGYMVEPLTRSIRRAFRED